MKQSGDMAVTACCYNSYLACKRRESAKMRKPYTWLLVVLIFALLLLSLFSCSKPEKRVKPLLLASIHPYELLLKQIAGDEFEVKSIIPPGASPHTWSPGPSDLNAFGDAAFILSNGLGLESNLEKNFATRAEVHVAAAELIKDALLLFEEHEEEHHETEHEAEPHNHGSDLHLWTSPRLMIRLAASVEKELSKRFPNSAFVFRRNAEAMRKELESLSEKIGEERRNYANPGIITYHNSFGHFCEEFKVQYLGWVQASPGKEPTPQELSRLGDTIKAHGVRAIFLEPQMDRKAGEVLAREFGLKLLIVDPLGSDGKSQNIAQLIDNNWKAMQEGFGKP